MQQAGDPGGSGVSADTVLVRAPKSLERRTVESVIVLGDKVPIVLRGTGIAIWEAFATARSIDDVVALLADSYREAPDIVRREMVPVVEQLYREGALAISLDSPEPGEPA